MSKVLERMWVFCLAPLFIPILFVVTTDWKIVLAFVWWNCLIK